LIRLYGFASSHYCEKARFALHARSMAFEEIFLAPGPHLWTVRKVTGGKRTSVPVGDFDGRIVQGSDAILDHLGFHATSERFDQIFDTEIGSAIRRAHYLAALADNTYNLPASLVRYCGPGMRLAFYLMWPVTKSLMKKGYDLRIEDIDSAFATLTRLVAKADELVADNPVLQEPALNRHIITAASLLSPLAVPASQGIYRDMPVPARMRAFRKVVDDNPSMGWTRQIYECFR
jgi:glutathione S-transferase